MKGRKVPLVVLEYPGGPGGGSNGARYKTQVLEKVLKGFYAEMREERGDILFMQDGAYNGWLTMEFPSFSTQRLPLILIRLSQYGTRSRRSFAPNQINREVSRPFKQLYTRPGMICQ